MLCRGGSYRANDNRYFILNFFLNGAIFWAARTSLLLKENHYSIGTFEEKSFVANYVPDS